MPTYFLVDDGKNMARWCEIAQDAAGNDVWVDFKGRRTAWEEGRPLAHVEGDSIRCPWHGSRFCLTDGRVLDGPAVFPERVFEVRVRDGRVEVRAPQEQ